MATISLSCIKTRFVTFEYKKSKVEKITTGILKTDMDSLI